MKGKRIAAFALTLVLGTSAAQPALAADWQSKNPLIAHALGEADGKIETNSKEAFLTSWQNGFRAVEADFTYTSDGTLVVRHDFEKDGSYYRLEIKPSGSLVMDTKTFTSTPAVYEQTPMTAVDLLYLMQEYPDMYLITDTKTTDKAQVQKQFQDLVNIANNIGAPEVLQRIIPQLYNKEMLNWIKEIYPFENWIFTLYLYANPNYDDIANFCAANGIDTVTLHIDRAKKENISKLKAKGLKVYAHTVNRYRIFEDALAAGVDGIYTDPNDPSTLIEEICGKDAYELIDNIENYKKYCEGASRKGANGAKAKLEYVKAAAAQGTRVLIANGKYSIREVLSGKVKCTAIHIR